MANLQFWATMHDGSDLEEADGDPAEVSDSVKNVLDQSGNNNDLVQTSASAQGSRVTAGLSTVTDDYYPLSSSIALTGDFTFAGVIEVSGSGIRCIWAQASAARNGITVNGSDQIRVRIDTNNYSASTALSGKTAYVVRRSGSTLTVRHNGAEVYSTTCSTATLDIDLMGGSGSGTPSQNLDGIQGTAIIYSNVLTGSDLSNLETFLSLI